MPATDFSASIALISPDLEPDSFAHRVAELTADLGCECLLFCPVHDPALDGFRPGGTDGLKVAQRAYLDSVREGLDRSIRDQVPGLAGAALLVEWSPDGLASTLHLLQAKRPAVAFVPAPRAGSNGGFSEADLAVDLVRGSPVPVWMVGAPGEAARSPNVGIPGQENLRPATRAKAARIAARRGGDVVALACNGREPGAAESLGAGLQAAAIGLLVCDSDSALLAPAAGLATTDVLVMPASGPPGPSGQ